MTIDLTKLVRPLVWAEEGPNFRIGRGAFGFHRSFRIFDGVAKIYLGTIGARVTPDRARQFYDAEYVSFILEALDPAALAAMLAEAEQRGREAEREDIAVMIEAIIQEATMTLTPSQTLLMPKSDEDALTMLGSVIAAIRARGVKT